MAASRVQEREMRVMVAAVVSRMSKALPPRKLVSFFQLENKLDAVVRADVARQIPLTR